MAQHHMHSKLQTSYCESQVEARGTGFTANSEKGSEGEWSQEGHFLTRKSSCASSPSWGWEEVIWKDILMSPHSTLPELSLHRQTEVSGSPHHPSKSAMQLKASSQYSPFALVVLHRWILLLGFYTGGENTKRQK